MINTPDESNLIADLLSQFVEDLRAGRNPQSEAFCLRAGDLASVLRPLLTTVASLEAARECATTREIEKNGHANHLALEQLGDFRLLREAGRGGMGIVYEAMELTLQRRVAIKVLDNRTTANPNALKRFNREARAAALLHHTNIVPVFGVGADKGVHFYVMPFIDGETLAGILASLRRKWLSDSSVSITDSDLESAGSRPALTTIDPTGTMESGLVEDEVETTVPPGRDPNWTPPVFAKIERFFSPKRERGIVPNWFPRSRFGLQYVAKWRCPAEPSPRTPAIKSRAYFRKVASIGMQVADALDHAFQQNVIHRDIKPSNLLLSVDGTVLVADFGLAQMAENEDLTSTGEILGTLRYLAPERLAGIHTIQGDIYGLGIVLYEMLTLELPFKAHDRPQLLKQIVNESPASPHSVDPSIPRDLETIALKAMAREVRQRYQVPSDLVMDLRLFLDDRPILSRRVTRTEAVWRWCRRNPAVAALLTSVVTLLIVIAAGSLLAAKTLREERDASRSSEFKAVKSEEAANNATVEARKHEKSARDARIVAEAADRQHRQDLYSALLTKIQTVFASTMPGQRLQGIDTVQALLKVLPVDQLTSLQQFALRNAAIACLSQCDALEVRRVSMPAGQGNYFDIDPTFQFIAVPGDNQESIIRSLNGTEPDQRLSTDSNSDIYNSERWFSPCGKWLYEVLATQSGGEHLRRVWNWRERRLVIASNGGHVPRGFCFHPDCRHLFQLDESQVKVYDLETGTVVRESPPKFRLAALSISNDGKYLACIVPRYAPVIVDSESFETLSILDGVEHSLLSAWSKKLPDLYVGTSSGEIVLGSQILHTHWTLPHLHQKPVTSLVVSPNGRFVASSGGAEITRIRESNGDRELVKLPGQFLRFSNDEKSFAVQSNNQLLVYDIIDSPSFSAVMQANTSAEFSPDGRWLATAGFQGVLLYATNPLTWKGDLGLDACGPVAWHPEGTEFATFGEFSHLARWKIDQDPETKDVIVGEPKAVALNSALARIGADFQIPQHWGRHAVWAADGSRLYYADSRHGHVWKFERDTNRVSVLADFKNASQVAVSPDGRWVSAANWPQESARVWDADTGACALELASCGHVIFSPDGRWMAASSRTEVQLIDVATWQKHRSFSLDSVNHYRSVPLAFSPGGDLLAAAVAPRQIRLFDVVKGDSVLDLTYRESADISWLSFSPDGARLAVMREGLDVGIWNLYRLRRELEAVGLDTDALPVSERTLDNLNLHSINRGSDLLPPNGWWSGFESLARFEALQFNYPDAIGNLDIALEQLQPNNKVARLQILKRRAEYHNVLHNVAAACADLREAVSLQPENIEISRQLADLLLFGSPDVQDSIEAATLLQNVCVNEQRTTTDQLNLLYAQATLGRTRAAADLIELLEKRGMTWDSDTNRICFELAAFTIAKELPNVSSNGDFEKLKSDAQQAMQSATETDQRRLNAFLQLRNSASKLSRDSGR